MDYFPAQLISLPIRRSLSHLSGSWNKKIYIFCTEDLQHTPATKGNYGDFP